MTTTYPLATLAAQVTSAGISAPSYNDILQSLIASFQSIYGSDAYLEDDSQDYQMLAVVTQAINDTNQTAIAVYNSFSPSTAQGAGLSSVVKINGLERMISSASTVDQVIVGQVGTTITNGITQDQNGNLWSLPASVVIPSSGTITVTATCQTQGAISPGIGTVNVINTPTLGWQSVTNTTVGAPGNPVEQDPALKVRQSNSVALPSLTVLAGIVGALQNISGVVAVQPYENDTNATNGNGLPAKTISLVVEGGNALTVAQTIMLKKTPGAGTYGTTSEVVTDSVGIAHTINFFRPTIENIAVAVTLTPGTNYNSNIGVEIQNAVAAYINALAIGQNVLYTRLFVPANLNGSADSLTYEITSLTLGLFGGSLSAADYVVGFNGLAQCIASNVTITT